MPHGTRLHLHSVGKRRCMHATESPPAGICIRDWRDFRRMGPDQRRGLSSFMRVCAGVCMCSLLSRPHTHTSQPILSVRASGCVCACTRAHPLHNFFALYYFVLYSFVLVLIPSMARARVQQQFVGPRRRNFLRALADVLKPVVKADLIIITGDINYYCKRCPAARGWIQSRCVSPCLVESRTGDVVCAAGRPSTHSLRGYKCTISER